MPELNNIKNKERKTESYRRKRFKDITKNTLKVLILDLED